ncbi:MAG: ABC transporter ATP-binding protein [Lachnospiraceae bacterium]|nr:ABC transporter ATP-binding protein [Lachnospiraceae bacterium]
MSTIAENTVFRSHSSAARQSVPAADRKIPAENGGKTEKTEQAPILRIQNLTIGLRGADSSHLVTDHVSIDVGAGEILGIVGESGCGKTVTNLAVMDLLPHSLYVSSGSILFRGKDLLQMSTKERQQIYGNDISMIYQEPLTSLNPLQKIGRQVGESLRLHERNISKEEIAVRVRRSLEEVGLPDIDRIMDAYPHQLSGGQRQRVMIAMATVCRPDLMIADEPTTALDVTVQAQVLRLLHHISRRHGMSVIFISHDLAVIRQICDRVVVMYAGQAVESAPVEELLCTPAHPYTKALLRSIPLPSSKGEDLPVIPGHVPAVSEKRDPCPFAPRCTVASALCREKAPAPVLLSEGHEVLCHIDGRGKEAADD